MNFEYTPEQEELRRSIIAFAQERLAQPMWQRDRDAAFDREGWKALADFGFFRGFAPAEFGGKDWDVETRVLALETLGYACPDNGLNLGVSSLAWTILPPILAMGSASQKSNYIPSLIAGDCLAADGITEPEAGSDALRMRTTATRADGGYLLNGKKRFIGFAPIADLLLVFAKTDEKAGPWGISAFLVDTEASAQGMTRSGNREKMGLRTLPMGDIEFANCFVPESARLGDEGSGLAIFTESMEWERSFILATQVGAMERQLEVAIDHAKRRYQFGQPIGAFQSVSHRIADMRVRLETSRLLLRQAAWNKSRGRSNALEASMAKLSISEAFAASSLDAIRIHGGEGYLSEYEVERNLRDATGGLIYAGTSDIQRNVISRLLGLP